ncbi:TadE/TadG family type IV pilus assembly protein [Novosphingobium sp. Gsoil 351]|uniref:TadE/TadG family type IV pilus assembly protein n=1 Tax=Novosphingobium sp. Gsoil 351 TaxID=2675225 RepID=UPI0018A84D4F|nr:TadE/TadG family type IV pilus assembly protein [Novosphingobium sp. Gsoil 351]
MLDKVKRLMTSLRRNISGNVLILFAAGAPVFIGGAGLAVDTAQWYMWKREMQYAVDQAAMAGAWSRVGGTTGNEYKTRAQQELTANLQVVDFQGTPSITLANYAGQTNNSVLVTLSATRELPFSKLLTGSGTTISVSAQAAFEKSQAFTACLIAVDPSTSGAIRFRGNAYLVARCGVAALSNSDTAIIKSGNGAFNVGYLVAAGQIDDALAGTFTDPHTGLPYTNVAFEGQTGLVDPFGELSPPNNPTPRTYACGSTTSYTAGYTNTTLIEDWTYTATGANGPWAGPSKAQVSSATQTGTEPATASTQVNKNNNPATPQVTTVPGSVQTVPGAPVQTCTGNGKNKVCTTAPGPSTYKRIDRVTTFTHKIDSVSSTTSPTVAAMQPGTYSSFTVSCNTTMASGVYVINGGQFKVNAQDTVTGAGVMIVLKNGASIDINGGSTLNLRAMSTTEMIAAGISEAEALKLKDMLIFEDRNSSGAGSSGDKLNGNAGAVLEGTVYLPKSDISFNGTFGVVSRCLVIAAKTIDIGGTADMASFCPAGTADHTGGVSIGGGAASVRLVA